MTARRIKGAWWVDFRFHGERFRKKSPLDSKRGAEEYERQLRTELLLPPHEQLEQKEVPNFKEYINEFITTYAETNNKASELASKRTTARRHLVPFFGSLSIREIGIRHIEKYKAKKLKEGLSPKSINNQLTVLRKALSVAVDWELIAHVPRVKWLKVPPPDFRFLTSEESEKLIAATPGGFKAMVMTAVKSGLRRGELLALQWADLDLKSGLLRVKHSCYRGKLTTPKNGKTRDVPLSPQLAETLKKHRHLRGSFVFCNDDGSMLTRDQVKRVVPAACKDAGLPELQWHALRHTFASQLVMAGVPMRTVQVLMGHSTLEMTCRYAHLAPNVLVEAVSKLDVVQK